jgi:glycosyltransferase involved in cell wall biosynthesis
MRRAHCFVLSSRAEGCSNALCEALALRMPVLASDIAGNRGLLGDDFPGYFPVGDAAALAEKLSLPLVHKLAEWAHPWPERLCPEREADDLCSLLCELSG